MECHTAEESRKAHVTDHHVPQSVWSRQSEGLSHVPDAFAHGFIHCTNGPVRLRDAGNMFCSGDWRDHLRLMIDTRLVGPAMWYDDPGWVYPHIRNPRNADAVIATRIVEQRGQDNAFVGFRTNESALRCC